MNLDEFHAQDPVGYAACQDAGRIPGPQTADVRSLGDVVKEGQELAPPPLRVVADSAARALAEFRALHQPERTVYPNGTEVVLADRDGDVVMEIGGEYLYLDEKQVAELASDLVWRAIKINPDVDWRLRAAHHALRDIHDDDDPWAS